MSLYARDLHVISLYNKGNTFAKDDGYEKNRYTYYKLTITRWDWIRCILL
ncbi:hypothetical protein LM6186_170046 [Listeria monocytogenes]|nr:hypothetical protein LM500008_230041 [Listeria monocytogenes]CUK63935.1 hypothetical protein LM600918_240042 [Listeria monocytogenes]CUK65010.1 hypothetical protein LM601244_100045 [Listeria monocytogenes]CUK81469.1 hypothetical protein LM6186_170046 [Listeria monocytogenes]CUK99388.1 hypothetical protein LM700876_240042 [Listeria monocytogenes]